MTENRILKILSTGDKRSVDGVAQAVTLINRDPTCIELLLKAICDDNEARNMRILDAIEKATREHFERLAPYKKILLSKLLHQEQKEIRWHVAQIMPRLKLSKSERAHVMGVLIDVYLKDKSSIVKTNTLQALTELALMHRELTQSVRTILQQAIRTGTPAMAARGKKLLHKLVD